MNRGSVLPVLLLLPVLAACTGGGPGSAPAQSSVTSVQQALVSAVERSVPAVVNIRTVTRFARGTPGSGLRPDGRPPEYLVDLLEENGGFRENSLGVEAHLLDFDGDLYGQDMTVRFRDRIRDEQKFKNVEELVRQIEKDVGYARSAQLPTNPETDDAAFGGRPADACQ